MFFFNMKPDFNTMLNQQGFTTLTLGLIFSAFASIFASMGARAVPGYVAFPAFLLCLVPCLLAFFSGALKIGKNASSFISDGLFCDKEQLRFLLENVYGPRARLDMDLGPK
jgi:hypothetical protein